MASSINFILTKDGVKLVSGEENLEQETQNKE